MPASPPGPCFLQRTPHRPRPWQGAQAPRRAVLGRAPPGPSRSLERGRPAASVEQRVRATRASLKPQRLGLRVRAWAQRRGQVGTWRGPRPAGLTQELWGVQLAACPPRRPPAPASQPQGVPQRGRRGVNPGKAPPSQRPPRGRRWTQGPRTVSDVAHPRRSGVWRVRLPGPLRTLTEGTWGCSGLQASQEEAL